MVSRYVQVELTQDECEAVAELAEVAVHQILRNQQFMKTREQETVRALINSVKMKMSVAATLFAPRPTIITPDKKGYNG